MQAGTGCVQRGPDLCTVGVQDGDQRHREVPAEPGHRRILQVGPEPGEGLRESGDLTGGIGTDGGHSVGRHDRDCARD